MKFNATPTEETSTISAIITKKLIFKGLAVHDDPGATPQYRIFPPPRPRRRPMAAVLDRLHGRGWYRRRLFDSAIVAAGHVAIKANSMITFRTSAEITADRRVVVNLPPETPIDRAELVVTVAPAQDAPSLNGSLRRRFGNVHSGDARSADNERIDPFLSALMESSFAWRYANAREGKFRCRLRQDSSERCPARLAGFPLTRESRTATVT